jgi:hypothetical protein
MCASDGVCGQAGKKMLQHSASHSSASFLEIAASYIRFTCNIVRPLEPYKHPENLEILVVVKQYP